MTRFDPILLVFLAGAAALLPWLAWRLLRRRVRRGRPGLPIRTRYPVVLVHGLLGFGELGAGPLSQSYFRGVAKHLRELGVVVHQPRLPTAGSVAERADVLATHLDELDAPRASVVAHSMGGLDARYAASRPAQSKKIAALVTVGTPHRGTPLADLGTDLLGDVAGLRPVLRALGIDMEAFYDLTTARLRAFNREVRNARGILYGSIVAQTSEQEAAALLRPTYRLLRQQVGANDGVVPASSQRWGKVLRKINADHWAQIGWSRGFDVVAFYEDVVRELRGRGY